MCVKILDNFTTICDFIDDVQSKDKLNHLFWIVAELQPLLYANRFLEEDEISKVEKLCDELGTYYPYYLPDENIFQKTLDSLFFTFQGSLRQSPPGL